MLADGAGMTVATLKAVLGGRARWRVGHLVRLAAALEVAPAELLPDVPTPARWPALTAAVGAGDAPAALRALADALDQAVPVPSDQDPSEAAMLRAMRSRDPSTMMALTADLMRRWGTD